MSSFIECLFTDRHCQLKICQDLHNFACLKKMTQRYFKTRKFNLFALYIIEVKNHFRIMFYMENTESVQLTG